MMIWTFSEKLFLSPIKLHKMQKNKQKNTLSDHKNTFKNWGRFFPILPFPTTFPNIVLQIVHKKNKLEPQLVSFQKKKNTKEVGTLRGKHQVALSSSQVMNSC